MTQQENIISGFSDRVAVLRREILDDIVSTLRRHNLERLNLEPAWDNITYVVAFGNDGYAYDCKVKEVSVSCCPLIDGTLANGISLEVEDNHGEFEGTLYGHDLGCRNLDWLCEIRENIQTVLELRNKEIIQK